MAYGLKACSCHPLTQRGELHSHTLQLNFLSSDWIFSKYGECIENVYCTPRTALRLHEVLLVRDRTHVRHIDWHEEMILFFCRIWIRLINLHFLLPRKCDKTMNLPEFDACPMRSALRASGNERIKIQCTCIGFVFFHSIKKMRIY